jgi:hypothetical protein
MQNMPPCPCCLREIIHSQIHRMKESNNELLTAHCIQLGWVEMPVHEKVNEAIEDNEDQEDNEDE